MFLLIISIFLCFVNWIFCYPLTNLSPSSWLILVLFWMLWILVTVHKRCHVPHVLRIKTWGTTFLERFFNVSQEWLRFGHTLSWELMIKRWLNSSWQSVKKKWAGGKKEKKPRMATAKLLPFHTNAKSKFFYWHSCLSQLIRHHVWKCNK